MTVVDVMVTDVAVEVDVSDMDDEEEDVEVDDEVDKWVVCVCVGMV